MTKINLLSATASSMVGISLAFYGAGVWSLVAQSLMGGIISNILLWSIVRWVPGLTFSWKALLQLWGFGFRMFLAQLIGRFFAKLDYLIIGKLFSVTTLGYLQRAKSLNDLATKYFSKSLMGVMFPVLSKIQNDLPRFQNVIMKSLGIISFIIFLLIGVLYVSAEELIVLLFSDKWLPSVEFFKILALSGFASPFNALLLSTLNSRGNSKAFLKLEIYNKIPIIANFFILYYWGITFYLYGLIVSSALTVAMGILFSSHEIRLPFFMFVKPIVVQIGISTLAVMLTIFIVKDLEITNIIMLLTEGTIFVFMYVLISYLMRTSPFNYVLEQVAPIVMAKLRR
jgi:O-antigen/teichoic acid export membrane protein